MPVFAWRNQVHRHFGPVYYPTAQILLGAGDGQKHIVSFIIDSGATISLLRRSVGDLLGLRYDSGLPIEMIGVGGAVNLLRVFTIPTYFAEDQTTPIDTRFAVSEKEDVPNLLGRLDIFDRFPVMFDPQLRTTTINVLFSQVR